MTTATDWIVVVVAPLVIAAIAATVAYRVGYTHGARDTLATTTIPGDRAWNTANAAHTSHRPLSQRHNVLEHDAQHRALRDKLDALNLQAIRDRMDPASKLDQARKPEGDT